MDITISISGQDGVTGTRFPLILETNNQKKTKYINNGFQDIEHHALKARGP